MRRALVEPRPNVPPRVGLIAASLPQPAGEPPQWEAGFWWQPEACGSGGIAELCEQNVRTPAASAGIREFVPYQIWEGERCSVMGSVEREWLQRAERLLASCESKRIEREFWRGDFARAADPDHPNDYLTNATTTTIVTAAAVNARDALVALEQGIADESCGAEAMIHASRGIVARWDELGMLRRERGLVLTVNDNRVVAGAGYDGSGPGAVAGDPPVAATDESQWAYATDLVTVRRGAVETLPNSLAEARQWAQAVDRELNNIMVLAQRTAAATFDGCVHIAAEIDPTA